MNRYVSVPRASLVNGAIPKDAEVLARTFSLEIKINEEAEQISIIAEPRVKTFTHDENYVIGKTWSLDIHDEFIDMSKDCYMLADGKTIYPKIQEAHIVKFRTRPRNSKFFNFSVHINKKEYLTGQAVEN